MAHKKDGIVQGIWGRRRLRPTLMLPTRLLTLTVALFGLAPARADQAALISPVPVACTRTVNGQLLLRVKLTGATKQVVDADFILDTGVNKCVLTDSMASRLGLKPEAGIGDDGHLLILNGKVAQLARVPLLEIGSIPCGPVPFVIIGARTFSTAAGQAVDGALGNNLLLALPALINLQYNEVTFLLPGPITADALRSVGMADATVVPLNYLDSSDTYTCVARIESGARSLEKNLVVDIGSSATMINGSDAHALGLSTRGAPPKECMVITGPLKVFEGKSTTVTLGAGSVAGPAPTQVGAMIVQGVTVVYPKGDLPDFLPAHLGRDVLDRYLILVDYAEKRMYLKPVFGQSTPAFVPKITIGGK